MWCLRRKKTRHRPLPKETRLSDVFCFEGERRVNNDWTIQYQGRFFQIRKENKVLPRAGQKVTIRRDLEGILTLHYKRAGHLLRGNRGSTEAPGAGKRKQTPFNPSTGAAPPLAGTV